MCASILSVGARLSRARRITDLIIEGISPVLREEQAEKVNLGDVADRKWYSCTP